MATTKQRKGAWVINTDYIADDSAPHPSNANAMDMLGPGDSEFWDSNPETPDGVINHPDAVDFRLSDDDGELYYEGVMVMGDGDEADCFGPLDDFGKPNAGCASLEYYDDKRNEWLEM